MKFTKSLILIEENSYMTICGIYKIQNKTNGKFYIGSSDNIDRRFSRHKLDLSKNRHDNQHLQNAWNKYGGVSFEFKLVRECSKSDLLLEEQKDLDIWVGKEECYNMRKDAKCPVAPGSKRPQWVIDKIAAAQRGRPRWTEEQKAQMSINRKGKYTGKDSPRYGTHFNHTEEAKKKISEASKNQTWSMQRCQNISLSKIKKQRIFTEEERKNISDGVQKAVLEGRYHKNKVPKEEYETIRGLYLSGSINKRQLAFKYGITPSSMQKLLQRIGV